MRTRSCLVSLALALSFGATSATAQQRQITGRVTSATTGDAVVGANVAVLVTSRRAIGLSPEAGGFFEFRLQVKERIREISARSNLATIQTDRRVLVFRAPTGTWVERRD